LTAQLGYNPYETAKSTAGQARNATTSAQHGNITAGSAGDHLRVVAPPQNPTSAVDDNDDIMNGQQASHIGIPSEFEEAMAVLITAPDSAAAKNSLTIVRKLIVNATTKGQQPGEEGAKFRKVRLANAKIKESIVDVSGAIDLLLAVGFSLEETDDGESCLLFPSDYAGPEWLTAALKRLEDTNGL
jgi:hypothetical protein